MLATSPPSQVMPATAETVSGPGVVVYNKALKNAFVAVRNSDAQENSFYMRCTPYYKIVISHIQAQLVLEATFDPRGWLSLTTLSDVAIAVGENARFTLCVSLLS